MIDVTLEMTEARFIRLRYGVDAKRQTNQADIERFEITSTYLDRAVSWLSGPDIGEKK